MSRISRPGGVACAVVCAIVVILSGSPLHAQVAAEVSSAGRGWSIADHMPPQLLSTRPVLGSVASVLATNCQPGDLAWLFVGLPANVPLDLGSGALLYVDTSLLLVTGPYEVNPYGTWLASLTLPSDPAWAGFKACLQLITLPKPGADQFDLSNGLVWTLGF